MPASALANATHWEEGAMTNPDTPRPAMRGFPFGLGKMLPFSPISFTTRPCRWLKLDAGTIGLTAR